MTIAVVDTGVGNLRSLANALATIEFDSKILSEPPKTRPETVILPGVGAFGHVAESLSRRGWTRWLTEAVESGTRVIGICLGMQLLFERSEESPGSAGLGILRGSVRRLRSAKLPHIGWAPVPPILAWAYFAHGYVVEPSNPAIVTARARAGEEFPAAVRQGNVVGVQFHPEKSQRHGLLHLREMIGGAP